MTEGFIPPHGGYRNLLSYRKAEIVYDATVRFCDRYIDRRSRTRDQMVQAARSGKQNIVEASVASGTSKEMEIKLTNVARAKPGGASGGLPGFPAQPGRSAVGQGQQGSPLRAPARHPVLWVP